MIDIPGSPEQLLEERIDRLVSEMDELCKLDRRVAPALMRAAYLIAMKLKQEQELSRAA